jgi:hypothetical protein
MEDVYVKERDRANIPIQYQWDLKEIYASDDEWAEAKRNLISEFSAIPAFKGQTVGITRKASAMPREGGPPQQRLHAARLLCQSQIGYGYP